MDLYIFSYKKIRLGPCLFFNIETRRKTTTSTRTMKSIDCCILMCFFGAFMFALLYVVIVENNKETVILKDAIKSATKQILDMQKTVKTQCGELYLGEFAENHNKFEVMMEIDKILKHIESKKFYLQSLSLKIASSIDDEHFDYV